MAKPAITKPAKKRVKFDEGKFFRYLGESASPGLLRLLRSIDRRARVEMSTYVIRYLRRSEEDAMVAERKRRGAKLKRSVSATISALQKAAVKYKALAVIEISPLGPRGQVGALMWPEGTPFFAQALESEAVRLSALLKTSRKLYSEKRFGVSGNHLWLVFLQEFVLAWTERELGEARQLRPDEIATLITAGKITLGWREDRSETDPELISKAILNFRKNPTNGWISRAAKSYALKRCDLVSNAPFLLGIEI